MPLVAPNLDDRKFADILAQAKTLIPRYTPEWTNFNDSDPGMTLVQLFAWMTEILVYRINQVPDLNYIKFLQLLGIERAPAQPAVANLTFSLARPDISYAIVPMGTQVAATNGDNQPIVFETDTALIAIGPVLTAFQSYDGLSYTDVSSRNNAGDQWFYPFGQEAQPGSALLLGFSPTVSFPAQEVDLTIALYENMFAPNVMQSGGTLPPPASLAWEYWNGSVWQPIALNSDGTRSFTQNGHVVFAGPGNAVQASPLGMVTTSLYWIRARIVSSSYENPPQLASVLINTVQATQAVTISDEVLGGSDGTPNQIFTTVNNPIVELPNAVAVTNTDGTRVNVSSLRLEVDEGQGFMAWQEVDDFFASGPNDPHFVLDRTTGQVTFGDGNCGRIPGVNLTSQTDN